MKNQFYIYYEALSDVQKSVYRELLSKIEEVGKKITVRTRCTSKDVFAAVEAIRDDHPEIFWITGQADVWSRGNKVESVEIMYNALADRLSYHKNKFQKAVDSYMSLVKGKSVIEQERIIHDKMINDISYVSGKYDQTAYASLVEHKAVCAGYTRGFQYLMQKIGVPCYYCRGESKNKTDRDWELHSWNIIKLGSDYYNVDITWDDSYGDSSDNISYQYYNRTDSEMSSDHIRKKGYEFLPKCNGKKYSFEKIYGVKPELEVIFQDGVTCRSVINSKQEFISVFKAEVKKGTTIQMSFPSQKKTVIKSTGEWVQEAIRSVYGRSVGWNLKTRSTDYHNGWYRMEINLQIKGV